MNEVENLIGDLRKVLKAKTFYNPIVKLVSSDYMGLTKYCISHASDFGKSPRDLTLAIKPVSPTQFKLLKYFRNYQEI